MPKAHGPTRANHTNSGGYDGTMDRVNRHSLDVAKGPDLKKARAKAPKALWGVHQNPGKNLGTQDRVSRGSFPNAPDITGDIMDQG